MSDNVININGKDHNIDAMSDQQKYLIKQIRALTAEADRLSFQLARSCRSFLNTYQ